jgi:hypothetical protein
MRRWWMALACLALASCGEEEVPANRIVLPAALELPAGAAPDLAPFRRVWIDAEQHVALFFLGDAQGMSAQFVDGNGLVDGSRLLSAEEAGRRAENDEVRQASLGANSVLTRAGLPDRSFRVFPAQGGSLLQANYGKLFFVSFLTESGDRLKLGMRADMALLAKLAGAAGAGGTFTSLPDLAPPGGKPGRLLFFTGSSRALSGVIADNASALFREVTGTESKWAASELPAPTSLSDTAAIAAIRQAVGAAPPEAPAAAAPEAEAPVENADDAVENAL